MKVHRTNERQITIDFEVGYVVHLDLTGPIPQILLEELIAKLEYEPHKPEPKKPWYASLV